MIWQVGAYHSATLVPQTLEKSWGKWKLIRLLATISLQHSPCKSQLKSYAVLLAHRQDSSNVEKRWNNPSPQEGVHPNKRKLQASDNTSLAIQSFRDTHSQTSPPTKNVFAYRRHHGCNTALLSLTEQWRKELDHQQIVGHVPMDLSKLSTLYPMRSSFVNLENMVLTTKPQLLSQTTFLTINKE